MVIRALERSLATLAEDDTGEVPEELPSGYRPLDALRTLTRVVEVQALAGKVQDLAVVQLRQEGVTWPVIAEVLGVSPQAASKRYGQGAG